MKYKNLKIIAVMFLLWIGNLQAQETIPATGGDASGTGGSTSYTIGQVVYTSNTGTTGSVAQGVQQPYEISTTIGIEVTNINLELSVYPNPTTDYLYLSIEGIELSTLSFQLYDLQGKLLFGSKLLDNRTSINMESMASSTYFLNIIEGGKELKTFKIIKN